MTITVHGNVEAMISDTNIPALNLKYDPLTNPEFNDKHFALLDTVGGKHSMRVDQFGRIHILFTNDLCLLPSRHFPFPLPYAPYYAPAPPDSTLQYRTECH